MHTEGLKNPKVPSHLFIKFISNDSLIQMALITTYIHCCINKLIYNKDKSKNKKLQNKYSYGLLKIPGIILRSMNNHSTENLVLFDFFLIYFFISHTIRDFFNIFD